MTAWSCIDCCQAIGSSTPNKEVKIPRPCRPERDWTVQPQDFGLAKGGASPLSVYKVFYVERFVKLGAGIGGCEASRNGKWLRCGRLRGICPAYFRGRFG
jgi:hypothetical protein